MRRIIICSYRSSRTSLRVLHLDNSKMYNVWLDHLKNKINKSPGAEALVKREDANPFPEQRSFVHETNVPAATSLRVAQGEACHSQLV